MPRYTGTSVVGVIAEAVTRGRTKKADDLNESRCRELRQLLRDVASLRAEMSSRQVNAIIAKQDAGRTLRRLENNKPELLSVPELLILIEPPDRDDLRKGPKKVLLKVIVEGAQKVMEEVIFRQKEREWERDVAAAQAAVQAQENEIRRTTQTIQLKDQERDRHEQERTRLGCG